SNSQRLLNLWADNRTRCRGRTLVCEAAAPRSATRTGAFVAAHTKWAAAQLGLAPSIRTTNGRTSFAGCARISCETIYAIWNSSLRRVIPGEEKISLSK